MGPPAFAGGNVIAVCGIRRRVEASMGPPAFAGGNLAIAANKYAAAGLQWGHRLSPVETREMIETIVVTRQLQWGHRLSPVETYWPSLDRRGISGASMGPPAFAGGNRVASAESTFSVSPGFNGATGFRRWKPDGSDGGKGDKGELQWGHRLSPVETAQVHQRNLKYLASFNGATGFRRWKPANALFCGGGHPPASMGPPAFAGGNFHTHS